MPKPPTIAGLYELIARKRGTAKWQRGKAANPATDPRTAHEAEVDAQKLDAEAERQEQHARSNEALIPAIELLIHDLASSSIQTADRTVARRDLENASMRLRRELGDKPES